MALNSLFMLKLPLNPNQPTNHAPFLLIYISLVTVDASRTECGPMIHGLVVDFQHQHKTAVKIARRRRRELGSQVNLIQVT